mgnify:CR=1 FL=1
MPPTIALVASAVLLAIAAAKGYRTLTALLVRRALPSTDTESPPVVDGEQTALTGELVVEKPVATGEAAVETPDRPVGAYLWRARFPDNTNGDLTISEWGWERQHWHTFASGLETGRVAVATDGRTVRLDPSWLREATDADPLEGLEIGGITKRDRLSVYLWDSWYTYLRDRTTHRSLRRFAGTVRRHNADVDLDRYLLEARPLLEGTTVSVSGELQVDQGEPVLRGTDESPLLLTDQGFDGHRRWLRRQILLRGGLAAGLLAVAVSLWFEFYVPLAVLIVCWIGYVGYHFVQDVSDFLDFLKRRWR